VSAQSAVSKKGSIKIDTGILDALEKENSEIAEKRIELEKEVTKWKNTVDKLVSASNLSDKSSLKKSIKTGDLDETKKELQNILNETNAEID